MAHAAASSPVDENDYCYAALAMMRCMLSGA
jgi:hypothetical protein